MNKEIEKKIKEKCKEMDLVEEDNKKSKINTIKWYILSGIVLILIIVLLFANYSDPTKVYEKEKQIKVNTEVNSSSNLDLFGLSEYLDSSTTTMVSIIMLGSIGIVFYNLIKMFRMFRINDI